jgi:hypothetical protein
MTKATKDTFCQLPHKMMRATHWVSPITGELIKLEPSHKIIWLWMEPRFKYFNGTGKQYFDNQDEIAEATGTSISTVKRFVSLLQKHGCVEVGKKRLVGFIESNSYVIVRSLILHCDKDGKRVAQQVDMVSPPAVTVVDDVDQSQLLTVDLESCVEEPVRVLRTFRDFIDELDGEGIDDAPVMAPHRSASRSDDPLPWE